jgi:hypothetical protein
MDRQPQAPQGPAERDPPVECGPGTDPRPAPQAQGDPTLNVGPALVRTVLHFFPDFNDWLDDFPDPRRQDRVVYHKRFLIWVGLMLFLLKLRSRRQIDFDLNASAAGILPNLTRLAGTEQTSTPVNKTVNDYLRLVGPEPLVELRARLVQRLLRNKVLDDARVQGRRLVLVDATEHLTYSYRHCDHCLEQSNGKATWYRHPVLEAKLLGPAGLVASVGTVFLSNADQADTPAGATDERRKQDCELKAFGRLAPQLKRRYPQLSICTVGDGLYACGTTLRACADNAWAYVLVFKEGRLPSVWADFQGLLPLAPENRLQVETARGAVQVYRWVSDLRYTGSEGREWTFNAVQCEETVGGQTTRWAWITSLRVTARTVQEVAAAGRGRWCEENQGFNTQKNSDLRLEHAYSREEELAQVYYYLLQIAHLLLQLVEKGSLLVRLARQAGRTVLGLFGSLRNIARRLLESFRTLVFAAEAFDKDAAGRVQIRLDSS